MDEVKKIADLTVAEFRALMQECFDLDLKARNERHQEMAAALRFARSQFPEKQGQRNG